MADREKFSVLIIGCGAIAGGYDQADINGPHILTHAKAFQKHEGFEITGCVDVDGKKAQDFAKIWGISHAYDHLDGALADRDYDVISICSITASHEEYLRHLSDGPQRLVFCEKPLTHNLSSAKEICDLYPDGLAVNYIRRFDAKIRQLAHDIQQGVYGSFKSGQAEYNKGLFNNGSHMVDLLHLFFGQMSVRDGGGRIMDFWPDDPTYSAQLELNNGAICDIKGSDVRQGMVFDLKLEFEKATIILDQFSHKITIDYGAGNVEQFETDLDQGMWHAVGHLYKHLTEGTALYSTAENAVTAMEICDAIVKKAEMKKAGG